MPPERVTVVHEGIEMEPWTDLAPRRDEARRKLGLRPDAVVASCPATLRPRKGQRGLVRAFAEAAADLPDAVLVLAGRGSDRAALLENPGIVRNRLKIRSTIENARAFLEVQREFGSFDAYIWDFTGGKPIRNAWRDLSEMPAETEESRAMSRDLKKRGFRFVGPTICYAYMQAAGLVNDHVVDCFRYSEV